MSIRNSNFYKSVFYAIGAQVVSLLASLAVSFIVPKLIDVKNYAYWQLFLFYVTYINISRFGLIDGLYLRLGGKDYGELEHEKLSFEWFLFMIFQMVVAVILLGVVIISGMDADRKFVFGSCCACIIIINSNNYFSYILQAVNQTKKYSVSIIIQNLFWFLAVGIILFFKIYSYKVIVVMYILGHIFAGVYFLRYTKEIWHVKYFPIQKVWSDMKENIKCGMFLMVSFYVSSLIIGSARIIIDNAWGVEIFGYFSFSLTLANFVLTFINQVSMVFFPALKRLDVDKQNETYVFLRSALGIILPVVLLGYLPICFIIKQWLPQYMPSLNYLAFFLPICIFDGKMQMLCSTYFKVLRKERLLMVINCVTMLISAVLALIGSYIVKNIYVVALSILFVIAGRSIVSEIFLAKMLNKPDIKKIISECSLVVIYIVLNISFNSYVSSILLLGVYIFYLIINKNTLKEVLNGIFKKKVLAYD